MDEGTRHNTPALDERMAAFRDWMVADMGRARTTATLRVRLVSRALRDLGDLAPPADKVEARRRSLAMARTPQHARNFCFAFRDYYRFIGQAEAVGRVTPGKKGKPRMPRYFTADEVSAFLAVIDDPRDKALFAFIAYTGFRIHEALKVTPDDVDLEARTVRVVGKGGKDAVVRIGPQAVPILREYMETREVSAKTLFYTRNGGGTKDALAPLSDQRVRVLTRRYAKRAGIRKPGSPHMFRHALATNLIENGCPLPFVQRQLRHSRVDTTMIYLHVSDKAYGENFERFVPDYG